jgi:hypothetical protein
MVHSSFRDSIRLAVTEFILGVFLHLLLTVVFGCARRNVFADRHSHSWNCL